MCLSLSDLAQWVRPSLWLPWGLSGKASVWNGAQPGSVAGCHEDPLEKGMAAHSSVLPWRIPWIPGAGRATAHGFAGWARRESNVVEWLTLSCSRSSVGPSTLPQTALFRPSLWPSNIPVRVGTASSLPFHRRQTRGFASVSQLSWTLPLRVSLWITVFSGNRPRSGTSGSCVSSLFSFLRDYHTVLHSDCTRLPSQGQHRTVFRNCSVNVRRCVW